MTFVTVWLIWVALGYSVYQYGGVLWPHWMASLAAIALIGVAFQIGTRREEAAPPLQPAVKWLLAGLIGIAIAQLLPLPVAMVRALSPMRAEVHQALEPILGSEAWTTLTLSRSESFRWTLTLGGLAGLFVLARELVWRLEKRLWMVVTPLITLASLEAVLGLAEGLSGATSRGTYVNRNHFAGLLEMAAPFAVMAAVAVMRSRRSSSQTPAGPALKACLSLLAAAVMLAAIVQSMSRGGFTFVLAGLLVMGAMSIEYRRGRRWRRWLPTALLAAAVVAAFVLLPTDAFIARFADLANSDELSADTRVQIWEESLELIADYPLTGAGTGAYESAFHRYQQVAPMNTVDHAHNDYLELMSEFGIPGFALLALLALRMFQNAAMAACSPSGTAVRYLGLACLGSLTALALHSLVDFNIYMPANAAILVWVAGVSEGLRVLPFRYTAPVNLSGPLIIDVPATTVG